MKNLVLIDTEELEALLEKIVKKIVSKTKKEEQRWITPEAAMQKLSINSSTTLLKYRREKLIRYSRHSRKKILYDLKSIEEFLEQKSNENSI